jgi:serine/threonine-protein kinase RsbW
MNQQRILTASVAPPATGFPSIEIDYLLSSEVAAISSFVDKFVLMLTKLQCIPGSEGDVEIALREALNNAVVHGNRGDSTKCVRVTCRCESGQVCII